MVAVMQQTNPACHIPHCINSRFHFVYIYQERITPIQKNTVSFPSKCTLQTLLMRKKEGITFRSYINRSKVLLPDSIPSKKKVSTFVGYKQISTNLSIFNVISKVLLIKSLIL